MQLRFGAWQLSRRVGLAQQESKGRMSEKYGGERDR